MLNADAKTSKIINIREGCANYLNINRDDTLHSNLGVWENLGSNSLIKQIDPYEILSNHFIKTLQTQNFKYFIHL